MDPESIADAIRPKIRNLPKTSLLCLENTHNLGGRPDRAAGAAGGQRGSGAQATGWPCIWTGRGMWNATVARGGPGGTRRWRIR